MKTYAVLLNPGHNRVYFNASINLAAAELSVAATKITTQIQNPECKKIAGVDYLTFTANKELTPPDIEIISGLSFVYALYELTEIGQTLHLRPIEKTNRQYIDESISSILKYTGKTNELFTRLMINVALYSYKQNDAQPIKLLDPVAGKGTTLFEGLIKGFDVYGVEIGEKVVLETYHFMKKFLETGKYKHKQEIQRISGPNKSFISTKYLLELRKSKENKDVRTFEIIAGSSTNAKAYYKKNIFDIIVGDLPYGVKHGDVTNEKQTSLTRNPAELLETCLPAWTSVLKPGGVMALAWNTFVLPREDMEQIFEKHGLSMRNEDVYLGFKHRVDQAVMRDIVVGVKR